MACTPRHEKTHGLVLSSSWEYTSAAFCGEGKYFELIDWKTAPKNIAVLDSVLDPRPFCAYGSERECVNEKHAYAEVFVSTLPDGKRRVSEFVRAQREIPTSRHLISRVGEPPPVLVPPPVDMKQEQER